ncbi:heat shock gene repressor HrcA [Clostridium saccharobutylicum]|nr:heat shock gene repressor HrcA [Clostridium saccharobutylicum]
MSIDDRKIKILQAIINDYIRTGDPVGSRTIAKNYDLGIGSATIRNEMADLEDMGYLEQPHASAGRIPSSKGYRLYVDKLMDNQRLTEEEDLKIKQYIIDSAMLEVDKIVRQTSALLSELTKLTCVIETPSVKKALLNPFSLLRLMSII